MAKVFIEESTLTNIGNAIRTKKGTTAKIDPANFASEIQAIETAKVQQNKYLEVTSNGSYDVTPDSGYNGIARVMVDVSVSDVSAPDEYESMFRLTLQKSIMVVTIPEKTKAIGSYAFYQCNQLVNVTLNEGLQEIGQYAFSSTAIKSIVMPSTLRTIGRSAFNSCNSLTSVTLNQGLTSINSSFVYCANLTNLVIPASVTTIEGQAFNIGSSSKKATIKMLGTTPPTISTNAFSTSALNKILIPASALSAYSSAANWSNLTSYFETY